jgi:hypothetical protein
MLNCQTGVDLPVSLSNRPSVNSPESAPANPLSRHAPTERPTVSPRRRLASAIIALCLGLNLTGNHAAVAAASGLLLVANKGDHSLGLIDPLAAKMIATVPVDGNTGHEVVASPDGRRAFVPIYGNAGVGSPGTDGQWVRVIDLNERRIVGTVDLGKGLRPHRPEERTALRHHRIGQLSDGD